MLIGVAQEVQAKPNPKAAAHLNQIIQKVTCLPSITWDSPVSEERESYSMSWTPPKEDSTKYTRKPPDKLARHYKCTGTSTHSKWKSTGGEAQEKITDFFFITESFLVFGVIVYPA
ncbi:hypothetical protein C4D60_Mb04t17650 [Musa balbisiana]|uniref:Uncharacterized protein n=1 Tax=Musa balbisiana TaxID=52838 RepID=A0A4S8KCS9_MUSBA|nr:hypothetical protein C4D60_Mb04t17650 [Musa balbisiana]